MAIFSGEVISHFHSHFSHNEDQLLKGCIRKVSQKVVPLHNDFMTLLCNYLCDMGYFL